MEYDDPPSSQLLVEPLSEREQDIIQGLSEGLTNAQLAERLFLALSTVKWYIRQLNQKLHTSNRNEIVERTQELGLLEVVEPTQSVLRPRDNLPRQTTPFVGRDAELDDIHRLIEKTEVRLLTILAPGGMGKTRVALEAVQQQINNFPDGVYFVQLQPISDVANIVSHIASSAGYPFVSDGREPKQQVLDFLANKQILLLMDNWEHLLNGVSLINEILQVAPAVKILATSREKLNLLGETVYVLQGMEFPTWETPEDALRYDAVQLLVQVAQRVKPDWQVTDDNLDYVARICKLTQGMPLGILLAMSWLDTLPIQEIAHEIQSNVDFLESEMRDMPDRQQSIRAIFDYSWDRLTEAEQRVFSKVSVFRGGFTRQAAEPITGASLRGLQGLVNKALLIRNHIGRYDVHELLRQFAEEQLKQLGDVESLQDAHMSYYMNALRDKESDLKAKRQLEALQAIDVDYQNVRLAWQRACFQRDFDTINGSIDSVFIYFIGRSLWMDGVEFFNLARESLRPAKDEALHPVFGKVLSRYYLGDDFIEQVKIAYEIAQEQDDLVEMGRNLSLLSIHASIQNDAKMFQHYTEKTFSTLRQSGDSFWLTIALGAACYNYVHIGETDQAHSYATEELTLAQANQNFMSIAHAFNMLMSIELIRGNYDVAKRYIDEAIYVGRLLANGGLGLNLCLIAFMYLYSGEPSSVQVYIQEAHAIGKDLNSNQIIGFAQGLTIALRTYQGRYAEAWTLSDICLENVGIHRDKALLRLFIGLCACGVGEVEQAIPHFLGCIEYARSLNSTHVLTISLSIPAMIFASRGETVRATELASYCYNHSSSVKAYWDIDPLFNQLLRDLESESGKDNFQTAWEQGKSLDLDTVVQELVDEFGGAN